MQETAISRYSSLKESINRSPDDIRLVVGGIRDTTEIYHTAPVRKEHDSMYLCMDATVQYELDVFAGDGIDAMDNARFGLWSAILVPEEYLSDMALGVGSEE